MKQFFGKIGAFFKKIVCLVKSFFTGIIEKIKNSKAVTWYTGTKFHQVDQMLWDEYPLLMQIPLSLLIIFLMEWLSRHSIVDTFGFVVKHTGPYLFNSFCVYACLSVVILFRRRGWWRTLISLIFIVLGIINCIVLINRVSPFGYTDLYMISDLLTMQDSNYFSAEQAMISMIAFVIVTILMIIYFRNCRKANPKKPFWFRLIVVVLIIGSLYPSTKLLRSAGIMTSYFGNLQQGYFDYGYLYGFSTSVLDRGMSRPFGYSENKIKSIVKKNDEFVASIGEDDTYKSVKVIENESSDPMQPNVIVMLLESFYDVSECKFIETNEDPIPYVHYLEKNFSTGHCIVPVVGAGTCNTEFEILTGMSCNFFGPGEYPQKTILKEISSCESFADSMKANGYSTHVVHNNGGNFYSRKNAFSLMGFDTFSSKEMLDITDYTPLGNWPTDDILIGGTKDSMDSTENPDYVYTITVEGHGAYPTYPVEETEKEVTPIEVKCEGKTPEKQCEWSYYINRIHNVDDFLQKYMQMLDDRGEPTIVIMFGDHLPTMGLEEEETTTGDLYKTKYFTWNNFGMPKEDEDLASYQLVAEYLNRLGIHDGNINAYHQRKMADGARRGSMEYMNDLEQLQYDQLYGENYLLKDGTDYQPTDIEMGINDVQIEHTYFYNGRLHIYGQNFTKWSKVYVNGEKVPTTYESGQVLSIKDSAVKSGDYITVCQLGSAETIFRESNKSMVFNPKDKVSDEKKAQTDEIEPSDAESDDASKEEE